MNDPEYDDPAHLFAKETEELFNEALRQNGLKGSIADFKWADEMIDRILSDFKDSGHVETERAFRSILDVPSARKALALQLGWHHFNLNRPYTRPNSIRSAADELQKLHFEIRRIKQNMVHALFDHATIREGKDGKISERPKSEQMIFRDLHNAESAVRAASDAVNAYSNWLVDTLGKDPGSPMAPTQTSISEHRELLNELLASAWCETVRSLTRKDDGEIYLQILGALLEAAAGEKLRANGSQHLPKGGKLLLANARKRQLVQEPADKSNGPRTAES